LEVEVIGKTMKEIKANMTGTIISILVKVGDSIKEGQDLISIESMKMEMSISSDFSGIIKEIKVKNEDFIQEGQVLITLE
jgi:biotin carboxyl carrier protein